ncbi:unnamed protein product [Ectocarpus sp. 4 AP-2014]
MVSGVTQQHRGGGGGNSIAAIDGSGGGPSIRFEGITLELSSFSGCQFDFGKSGNLVLSFNGYTGTVSLQSSSSSSGSSTPKIRGEADSYALPLCSTSSEAGSLGVLDAEAVAMDQSDYDMALSQLEHGDSPKSSFSTTAAGVASTSPTTAMFNSPSAMRKACEGAQNPDGATAASGGSARKQQQKQQQQQQAPPHVSPSSSMKSGGNASVIGQQAASPSAGVGPRNKRSSPSSSSGGAAAAPAAAAGTPPPAVSPDAQGPSTAATTTGKPKGKRARRARGEESTNASGAGAGAASSSTKTNAARAKDKTKRAAVVTSKKTARAKRQQQSKEEDSSPNKENRPATKSPGGGTIVEAMDEEEDDDDEAHVHTHVSDDGSSASEEEEEEEGGAASPSSSAAAAWIAISSSSAAAAALPASPGPLSRSARAQVVAGVGVGARSRDGGVGPMGRWGHTATMISESTMMVLGGQADDDAHQATLGDLYKFDFATESWSRPVNCDSIPRAWHSASFIKDKNLLVIFGGERTVDGCPECLDDIMVLDTDIDLLYPPAISGKCPTARSGHSAAIIGTDLVVFGGVRGRKWQNNVAVLDTERWHWRHPTIDGSNPAPRSYHTSTVVGNLMVVFGGNNQNESFDKVHVLDTSKSRWVWSTPEVVGVAPPPRTGHSAVLLPDGHTIFIHGGWDPEDEGGVKNFGDAYLLDTNLWEWTRGPELLLGADEAGLRVGHTAVLARCNSNSDATAATEGEGFEIKAAYFGGQDGDGVRRSELALLTL